MRDESSLIRAAQGGDRGAFDALVTAKRELVLRAAYQVTGDLDRAQDVAQQVFLKLWTSLDRYDPARRFDTWIYRVTVNTAIDGLRRRAVRPERSLDDESSPETPARPEADAGERGLDLSRLRAALIELAADLSPQQRSAFVLREIEGLSGPEVARVLGVRDSTVRNHLLQARRALRRGLRRRYPELLARWGIDDE